MLRFLLILALLFPPAPEQAHVEWTSPQTARIAWQHPDAGNYWAVYKQTPWGWLTIEESFDAEPGPIAVLMGPRGEYSPGPGAHYLIQVAQRDEGSGIAEWSEVHGPYTLGEAPWWTLLPVVRR